MGEGGGVSVEGNSATKARMGEKPNERKREARTKRVRRLVIAKKQRKR